MKKDVVLLPAQSKRLIAKAIFQAKFISDVYKNGNIIICRGTTNSYLLEEFLKKPVEKLRFTSGVVMPGGAHWIDNEKMSEVIIRNGVYDEMVFDEIVHELSADDIIFKGANAINYAKSTAGILILNPRSGTVLKIVEALFGKRARLIVPVGLEKETSFDLDEVSQMMGEKDCSPDTPRMFSVKTELFTEIEAIRVLTQNKVESYHIGTGGILGAQGAVRLLLEGDRESVEEVSSFINKLPIKDEFR
ncbi:MAG: hypothetical protein ACQESP_12290 [Candidatus Muiribacteriota bacterium]